MKLFNVLLQQLLTASFDRPIKWFTASKNDYMMTSQAIQKKTITKDKDFASAYSSIHLYQSTFTRRQVLTSSKVDSYCVSQRPINRIIFHSSALCVESLHKVGHLAACIIIEDRMVPGI